VRDIVDALNADGAGVSTSDGRAGTPDQDHRHVRRARALHPEVAVTVKVNVARSPDEAEQQAQGVDVMAAMFEDDRRLRDRGDGWPARGRKSPSPMCSMASSGRLGGISRRTWRAISPRPNWR
jgi:hypothetical protein